MIKPKKTAKSKIIEKEYKIEKPAKNFVKSILKRDKQVLKKLTSM